MKIAVLDFETELLDGTPSTEFYRTDFRAKSAAILCGTSSYYAAGESDIRSLLVSILSQGSPEFVCHNLQFEWGVVNERFPELVNKIRWHADTARLVQLGDNGAGTGVGLEKSAARWLPPKFHDHKKPYHDLIRDRGYSGSTPGSRLDLLTSEEIRAYNLADVEVTFALYTTLTKYFKEIDYDWQLDWALYSGACQLSAKSKSKGVSVARAKIESSRSAISHKLHNAEADFREQHRSGIAWLESRNQERALSQYKTDRGRDGADPSKWTFNIDSDDNLRDLFAEYYQIKPQFFTPKGKPSMSSKFMSQWQGHADILKRRGNQAITLTQLGHLEEASRYDERVHFDVRLNGTKTGRGATGDES